MERKQILKVVITALFAALVAAGAFIRIPLPPVPITLQTLFALIAGCVLPLPLAAASIAVYLFLGIIGLPIFTSGGGLAAVLGPTGGYLMGLLPAVIVGAIMTKAMKGGRIACAVSSLVMDVIIYAAGLVWLGSSMELSFMATLSAGLIPFIVGDVIKYIVTVMISPSLRKRVEELLSRDE